MTQQEYHFYLIFGGTLIAFLVVALALLEIVVNKQRKTRAKRINKRQDTAHTKRLIVTGIGDVMCSECYSKQYHPGIPESFAVAEIFIPLNEQCPICEIRYRLVGQNMPTAKEVLDEYTQKYIPGKSLFELDETTILKDFIKTTNAKRG